MIIVPDKDVKKSNDIYHICEKLIVFEILNCIFKLLNLNTVIILEQYQNIQQIVLHQAVFAYIKYFSLQNLFAMVLEEISELMEDCNSKDKF